MMSCSMHGAQTDLAGGGGTCFVWRGVSGNVQTVSKREGINSPREGG